MNFKDFIKTVDDDSNKKGDQFEKFDNKFNITWWVGTQRDQIRLKKLNYYLVYMKEFLLLMIRIRNFLSEKFQELKSNDELKLAALSGFTSGVLLVTLIYNIY